MARARSAFDSGSTPDGPRTARGTLRRFDFDLCRSHPLRPLPLDKILLQIAAELKVRPAQITAAVGLLDGGATVPFIARYRKEATDNLDDIQLAQVRQPHLQFAQLKDRKSVV